MREPGDAKRSRPPSSADHDTTDKRRKILAALSAVRGQTKSALARSLQLLHDRGCLADALVCTPTLGQYRRGIQSAVEHAGLNSRTPYGNLIQEMQLPSKRLPMWHYISPFALMAYLCFINPFFFDLIQSTVTSATRPLRIILYIDEVNPGNSLRPDKSRLSQAIYWTFAELPAWFPRRKDSWF